MFLFFSVTYMWIDYKLLIAFQYIVFSCSGLLSACHKEGRSKDVENN